MPGLQAVVKNDPTEFAVYETPIQLLTIAHHSCLFQYALKPVDISFIEPVHV